MMKSTSMSKSVLALTVAMLVGAGALSPVLAATKMRSQAQPAPQSRQIVADASTQQGSRTWSDARASANVFDLQGSRCITDEGYGRFSYCDTGSN